MYITEIFEAQEPSSILVIYPGRFQPWHKGHKMVYDYLTKIYGRDHVFVATSNKVDPPRSPFTFSEKQQFMHLTGISADRIVETRDPYRALEIVQKYNPKTTRLVLAVSEKDMAEDPRFKFGYKKDGSPTYLQQMPKSVNDMQPFETHGYIMTVPTFDFTVLGEPMRSATEVRAQFAQADESTQQSIIKDLFGIYDRHVHDIMKQKLLPVVTESVAVGTKLNLTKNYGNFETLTGVVKDITPSGKLKIQITQAQLVPGKKGAVRVGDVITMASNYVKNTLAENFADGKNPQDKGDAKRHGINTKASVSSLRKTAKQGGRKGQLAHWLANMKSGRARAKNEGIEETINPDILNARFKHKQKIGDYTYTATAEDFEGAPLLWIKAYDGNKQVGEALFEIIVRSPGGRRKPSADYIESGGTEVDPEYRNKGIASTMYAYAKMLGNDVQPSTIQRSDGKAMWAAWAKSGAAKHLVGTSMEAKMPEASGQDQVNQQNKKFILYLNNQAIAEFDTEYEARQQGQVIVSRVPNTQIEIKQEICTLSSIELKENLKKCVAEAWSQKYKNSINCSNPKGFSQKAHCASKNEDMEGAQKKNGLPNISLHQVLDQQGVAEAKTQKKEVVGFRSESEFKTWKQYARKEGYEIREAGNLPGSYAAFDDNGKRVGYFYNEFDLPNGYYYVGEIIITSEKQGVAEDQNLYRRPTAGEVSRTAQQTQAKLNPTASKFVWKKPNQIGGSYSEQDLMAKGFKKSQYNSWGGTQAMWDRLTRVSEQLNQPTPTAQQILDKHNLTVEEFMAQLRLGVKVEFEHTKDAKTAYEIALDHLNERPDYYTKLMNVGLESIGEQSGSNNKKVNYREVGFFDAENYIENRSRVLDLTPAERNAYNYGYKYGASTRHRRINPSTGKPYIIFDKNGPYSPLVNPIYTVPIEEIPTEKSAAITALQKKLSSLPKDSKVYEKYKAQLDALSSDLSENSANPRVDLTPNYPNYSKLIGEFMGVNRNQKAVFKILAAELKPGQGSTDKIVRSVGTGKLVAIDISRVKNRLTVAEAASGYIPTQAEKDDPRFKTALTVDVRPGTDKKNMRALRLIK